MDVRIVIAINLILWSWTLYLRFQSLKVELKLKSYNTYLITFFFMIIGLVLYFRFPNHIMIFNFLSFFIAGFLINTCPSGFCKKGIFVLGKNFKYKNISNLKLIDKYGVKTLSFYAYKRCYFLYLDEIDDNKLRYYLKKLGGLND